MMTNKNLLEKLMFYIPELQPFYNEEIKGWDEFPGYHNIFGNVLNPFLFALLKKENQHNLKKRIFEFLEEMANSEDKNVENVLIVTVLERIGDSEDIFSEAKKYMGKKTYQLSKEVERWLGRR